jgi:hypothetical protein
VRHLQMSWTTSPSRRRAYYCVIPATARALTPIGKYRADELARAIATASKIHVITRGRAAHSWFVRCSCGEFSTSRPTY